MESTNIKTKTTPKDFFLYLGAMVALYVSAISLLTLLFQYVNVLFPDNLDFYRDYSAQIRWSIASIIIIFPLYVLLTRLVNSDLRKNEAKKDLWIRKWLIYLTLFISVVTMAIDLVVLVNTFLGGEITMRFIFKVISILVVVGAVFGYYFGDLRGKWEREEKKSKMVGVIASVVVLLVVTGGFFVVGSPNTQRLLRYDSEKINDLSNIQWQLVNYWQGKKKLPSDLSLLNDPISGFVVPKDEQTGGLYEYRTLSSLSFELCATFNMEKEEDYRYTYPLKTPIQERFELNEYSNWGHGGGRMCFVRTIDPELYPPFDR